MGKRVFDFVVDEDGIRRFTEVDQEGVPVPKRPRKDCPLLGVHRGRAIYLLRICLTLYTDAMRWIRAAITTTRSCPLIVSVTCTATTRSNGKI